MTLPYPQKILGGPQLQGEVESHCLGQVCEKHVHAINYLPLHLLSLDPCVSLPPDKDEASASRFSVKKITLDRIVP